MDGAWLLTVSYSHLKWSLELAWLVYRRCSHPDVSQTWQYSFGLVSVCCSCFCSVFLLFSFIKFCFIPHCFLTLSPFPPTPPHQTAFFCPFLCLDFPILVYVQSVPYFSGGCSFWANRMLLSCCVFKALILLLSYKTKLDVAVGLLFTVYFSLCCTG